MVAGEAETGRMEEGERVTPDHLGMIQALALKEPLEREDGYREACIYCKAVADHEDPPERTVVKHAGACPWAELHDVYAYVRVLQSALALYADTGNWDGDNKAWYGPGRLGPGLAQYVIGLPDGVKLYNWDDAECVRELAKELDRKTSANMDWFFGWEHADEADG